MGTRANNNKNVKYIMYHRDICKVLAYRVYLYILHTKHTVQVLQVMQVYMYHIQLIKHTNHTSTLHIYVQYIVHSTRVVTCVPQLNLVCYQIFYTLHT